MPVRPLPPALAEKARVELDEDHKRLDENIRLLKEWILEQSHLRVRTDDQWLAAFLRGCKFRLDQSKAKLDLYFSYRSKAPYLYSVKHHEPKCMDILTLGTALILRKTAKPEDPRVIIYRLGRYDPKEYTAIDMMAVINLQQQICFMEDDNLVVAGTVHIVDLSNTRLAHYTQTSLKQVRHLIGANQEALPVRIKAIHFINTPPFFETFFNICKRFMHEKGKKRVMVHGKSIESLHEHVSKVILPEEYGGTGESIEECIGYWKSKMREYNSFFEDDLKYGSDESKRHTKSQSVPVEVPLSRLEID